jgi:CRISPR-associated endonuclease/helicase Cas3
VAAAGRQLLKTNSDLRRRLARLCGIQEEPLLDWICFLLALHDFGKLSDSFQRLREDLMVRLQGRTSDLRYVERHDALGLTLWGEVVYPALVARGALGLESTFREDWADLLRPWLSAVFGHHGKPVTCRKADLTAKLFPSPVQDAALLFVQSLAELFLPAGLPFPLEPVEQEDRFRSASWLFAGVAVAADWIGSNSEWFPFLTEPLELAEYWRQIQSRSETAVRKSGLVPAAPGVVRGIRELWPEKIPTLTPLQELAESVELANGPHLFVVEEVTGGGKTEAALMLAHRLIARGEATGLYFALPTMATANAMYGRVEPVYRRFFQEGESPVLVLAHSRRDLFLPQAGLEETHDQSYEPRQVPASIDAAGWLADSRKKSLLAHVGVGTIDQALVGVLPLRHQSLRLLGLAGKVLIVDEVHACDEYVRKLLATLLRFHAAHGGSAVLLSATLPQQQRAELLAAFAIGAGWKTPQLRETGYPLMSHLSRPALQEIHFTARPAASRRVEVMPLRTPHEVQEKIAEALDAGRCVAWIRNTVGDAREAYLHWRQRLGQERVTLFHSRFTVGDRAEIERQVLHCFGPGSTPDDRRGHLLVATQVIEQSLDLDFDFLVTDLCPMDLIIQRAGRLHRHRRAEDRGPAVLGLFSPPAVSEPAKSWYQKLFPRSVWVYEHVGRLWLTARWLEEHGGFRMPEDARDAIEWVYGTESGDRIPAALQGGSNRAEGTEAAERSLALVNRLKLEKGYEATALDWPEDAYTPTRLGEPTVTLRLVRETPDGRHEPWHPQGPRAWEFSEVSVRRSQVQAEDPALPADLLAMIRGDMRDEGRYSVLVILRETDGQAMGRAAGPDKTLATVSYSRDLGFGAERS